MNCNLCNESLGSNTIKYKCGHVFHKCCLLPKIMSILNPECKICNNGKIDGYPSDKEDEHVDDDEDVDDDEHVDDDEVDKEVDVDKEVEEEYDDADDAELTRQEKIILCETVLFGLSLVGLIVGIIYR